jgi:hypothetical protein
MKTEPQPAASLQLDATGWVIVEGPEPPPHPVSINNEVASNANSDRVKASGFMIVLPEKTVKKTAWEQ